MTVEPRQTTGAGTPVLSGTAPLPGLEQIARALRDRPKVAVGGLWGSAQAFVLAKLAAQEDHPWLALVSNDAEAEALALDLGVFGADAVHFPERALAGSRGAATGDTDSVRRRLQVTQRLSGPASEHPRIVVASVLSMLQPVPNAQELEHGLLELRQGQRLDTEHLLHRLVHAGFTRQPLVEKPGEVSVRGDIFDVFPFVAELPLRIEMFDDEVESLRTFEPVEQRSVETLKEVTLNLTSDAGGVEEGHGAQPAELFGHQTVVVEVEPLRIEDAHHGISVRSASHQRALGELEQNISARRRLQLQSLPASGLDLDTRSVQALSNGIPHAAEGLVEATSDGTRAVVLCRNESEAHRFSTVLAESPLADRLEHVDIAVGTIAKGFRMPALDVLVVNHRELAGLVGVRRIKPPKKVHKTRALQSFFELKPGDFVVHAVHGLALYKGLELVQRGEGEEEHLHLLFADDVSLFVPVTRIDLVQRYIGSGGTAPVRDKIGSHSFRKRRERVEKALVDLASELLEVQAKRELRRRPAWLGNEELVRDLIGSFPYVDTPDQATADVEIAGDLAGPRPMDRLLCGDVGFGKTELAIRAAFRVAAAGGQVAVLVPTTLLAHQHTATFRERLVDFPIEVASLSRTIAGKAGKDVRERTASGAVDILIGTHRILSKDVTFKNLGLVIIDEEQRFGVTHKEHFKAMRHEVDVLALSATPIPRTLHMSLAGVRDISALASPPPGRQEIETKLVDREDEALLREAILAEKNRQGQVFFLHNRVTSIERVARELSELVPECSFAIGHGQMGARQLERVMDVFEQGEVDVLVATTIVENGLDIPAAGTIFIDDADHFGLGELHQLRGRVGRGSHKAYCYLLLEKYKPIRQVARERLKALEELNQLGAGFAISMKDLEIRGAGNILGPQQSGHIASVGYDMYCRLLKQTVERMKAGLELDTESMGAQLSEGVELELGLRAYLPETWIPSEDTRLEILRVLDEIHTVEEATEAGAMLRDRFGRLPAEAEALLRSFALRAMARPIGITRVSYRNDVYLLEYTDRVDLETALRGSGAELRPIRTGIAHLVIPHDQRSPERALAWLEDHLKPTGASPRIARKGNRR